jgi:hypothetical protein
VCVRPLPVFPFRASPLPLPRVCVFPVCFFFGLFCSERGREAAVLCKRPKFFGLFCSERGREAAVLCKGPKFFGLFCSERGREAAVLCKGPKFFGLFCSERGREAAVLCKRPKFFGLFCSERGREAAVLCKRPKFFGLFCSERGREAAVLCKRPKFFGLPPQGASLPGLCLCGKFLKSRKCCPFWCLSLSQAPLGGCSAAAAAGNCLLCAKADWLPLLASDQPQRLRRVVRKSGVRVR